MLQDSLVNSVAYFIKNDSVKYDVKYNFSILEKNDTIKNTTVDGSFLIKIKDSTATNYIINWKYLPTKDTNSILNKPFHILYETDELGAFKQILNTNEIFQQLRDQIYPDCLRNELEFIKKLVQLGINKTLEKEIFPMIENILMTDIFTFHNFFGGAYFINKPNWGTTETENPINKKNVETTIVVTVEDILDDNEYYVISSSSRTDKNAMKQILQKDFKMVNDSVTDFANDSYITQVVHNSGWPVEIELYNELIIGELSSNKHIYYIIKNE